MVCDAELGVANKILRRVCHVLKVLACLLFLPIDYLNDPHLKKEYLESVSFFSLVL